MDGTPAVTASIILCGPAQNLATPAFIIAAMRAVRITALAAVLAQVVGLANHSVRELMLHSMSPHFKLAYVYPKEQVS